MIINTYSRSIGFKSSGLWNSFPLVWSLNWKHQSTFSAYIEHIEKIFIVAGLSKIIL